MASFGRDETADSGLPQDVHEHLTVCDETPPVSGGGGVERPPLTREIPGRYQLVREYARGGMGRILIVHDVDTGRHVALKELVSRIHPDASTIDSEDLESADARTVRFLREARITGQLEHPAIVPIYEMGWRTDGTLYYTMKQIRGRTFEDAIRAAQTLSDRLALLPHFVDLCQAIAYAHSRGIIHRDIKPPNVLLGEFGETIVIDWGLATSVRDPEPACASDETSDSDVLKVESRLTRDGYTLGTPGYMSPEQIRGDLHHIAEPSDVYALGVILYELLTGQHPYEPSDAGTLFERVLSQDPTPVRRLEAKAPAELEAICFRAMNKELRDRYRSAGELVDELKRFQAGAIVDAYRYTRRDRLRRFIRQHTLILLSIAVAVVAMTFTGTLAFIGILREQTSTEFALYQASINLAYNSVGNGRLEEAEEALMRAPRQYRGLEWGLMQAQCHPERLVLPHEDPVGVGVYSPDGTKIVTCSNDKRAYIWDAATGVKLHEFSSPTEHSFNRAVWSPDGKLLVMTTVMEYTFVYDTGDYEILQQVKGYAPAMSRDGRTLALATDHGEIIAFYEPLSGRVIRTFPRLPVHVIQLAFSNDGCWLAAGINNGTVWVWSLVDESAWQTEPVHAPSTRFVVFSPDSSALLSTGARGNAILWNTRGGKELRRLEGHESGVGWACFLRDGTQLLTASSDRTARVWDTETGRELANHRGFSGPLGFVSASPDGSEFITHVDSNSGRMAAVIRPVIPLEQRQTLSGHGAFVNSVAFSPDGSLLASGGGSYRYLDDDRLILWDTRDNTIRREIKTGHGPVLGVAYFPDDARVATGNEDGTVSIYDVATGRCLHTMAGHTNSCGSVAVSPDGSLLASASWDNDAVLWDTDTGARRAILKGDPNRLDSVVFDPRGEYVATGGMDGKVRLYRVSDGGFDGELVPEEVQRTGELVNNRRIGALAYSPDGRLLVTAGDSGLVTLWDMEHRREIGTFDGHKNWVKAAVFSHDGHRLITAGKDAAIWFWDVETRRPVMFLERHKSDINALALRGDDGQLASASNDNTIVLWPIAPWRLDR